MWLCATDAPAIAKIAPSVKPVLDRAAQLAMFGTAPPPRPAMSDGPDSGGGAVPYAALRSVSARRKTSAPLNNVRRSRAGSERERRAAVVEYLRLSDGDVGRPDASGHAA